MSESGILGVIETSEDGRFRAVLMPDSDCESPLVGDSWVTSVAMFNTWSGQLARDPVGRVEAWYRFCGPGQTAAVLYRGEMASAFTHYMETFHKIEVFEVAWGAERLPALAWVEPSEAARVGFDGKIAPVNGYDAAQLVQSEVAEFNMWADGEVYGYAIQERVQWQRIGRDGEPTFLAEPFQMETWEGTDEGCWGLIGAESAEEEARVALARVVAEAEDE